MRRFPGSSRRRRFLPLAVGMWVALWVVVGVATGIQVRNLTEVSDSIVESGKALDAAGIALQDIGRLPIVGERPRELGNQVRTTAEEIDEAGMSSRETVRLVSVLLGVALVLIPVVPIVAIYLPLRRAENRERGAVARAMSAGQPDPLLEEFLANHAVHNLSYDELRHVSADPWGDLRRGSYRRLANAELTRLGLATGGGRRTKQGASGNRSSQGQPG